MISNNCGGRRLRPVDAAGQRPDRQDDLLLYRATTGCSSSSTSAAGWSSSSRRRARWAERIRAGGAGIAAFYTRTGVGTIVAEGKPVETFGGEEYVRETGLVADLSIVKAWKGDPRRQPRVPQDRAQLQSGDGDRGQGDDRRGGGAGAARRARSRPRPHARHLCEPADPGASATRSGSSTAPRARARRPDQAPVIPKSTRPDRGDEPPHRAGQAPRVPGLEARAAGA